MTGHLEVELRCVERQEKLAEIDLPSGDGSVSPACGRSLGGSNGLGGGGLGGGLGGEGVGSQWRACRRCGQLGGRSRRVVAHAAGREARLVGRREK